MAALLSIISTTAALGCCFEHGHDVWNSALQHLCCVWCRFWLRPNAALRTEDGLYCQRQVVLATFSSSSECVSSSSWVFRPSLVVCDFSRPSLVSGNCVGHSLNMFNFLRPGLTNRNCDLAQPCHVRRPLAQLGWWGTSRADILSSTVPAHLSSKTMNWSDCWLENCILCTIIAQHAAIPAYEAFYWLALCGYKTLRTRTGPAKAH